MGRVARTGRRKATTALLLSALLWAAGCSVPLASGGDAFDAGPPAWTRASGPPQRLAWPVISSHGGPVLSPFRLVSVLQASDPLAPRLSAFGQALAQSAWWPSFGAEYGLAAPTALSTWGPPLPDAGLGSEALRAYLQAWFADGGVPPDGRTVYLVYVPFGVSYSDPEQGIGCQGVAAEHFPLAGVPYVGALDQVAVVLGCQAPADAGASAADALTALASHEIAEAATDPTQDGYNFGFGPRSIVAPWRGSLFAAFPESEVGDLCLGSYVREAGYLYQRVWSGQAASGGGDPCVPPVADPYFNVVPQLSWYAAAPGGTVSIPVIGFSTGSRGDWALAAQSTFTFPSDLGVRVGLTSATSLPMPLDAGPWPSVNAGRTATLTVTLPDDVGPFSYAVIALYSVAPEGLGADAPGDAAHLQYVGVFVP